MSNTQRSRTESLKVTPADKHLLAKLVMDEIQRSSPANDPEGSTRLRQLRSLLDQLTM